MSPNLHLGLNLIKTCEWNSIQNEILQLLHQSPQGLLLIANPNKIQMMLEFVQVSVLSPYWILMLLLVVIM